MTDTPSNNPTEADVRFMRAALREAQKAFDEGEVPIGAVVVVNDRIIAYGHNSTENLNDVTAHAEMIALTSAMNRLGSKYLPDATLYVTVEPCLMCAGAIGWSQVKRIVFGAADEKRGYSTFVSRQPFHPKAAVVEGVLADEAADIMRRFFADKR